ncbi:MAG TPA: hypothetical protein VJP80_05520 [Candidatus Saccharimonadales bacterium]|nr:hypothetical protein [Candidatus Saccharimonadales bacterium]
MGLLNRTTLHKLSAMRIVDAQVLLKNKRYCGAYYLAGYAVECSLKARIAQNTRRYDFPDKQLAFDSYTHDLDKLIRLAGLNVSLERDMKSDGILATYWSVVKDWSEEDRYSRYNQGETKRAATDLIRAITDSTHGILQWIEKN